MYKQLKLYRYVFFLMIVLLSGCKLHRKLITDEVVYKDGNTQTGTIIKCDTQQIRLKKADESVQIIFWSNIDSVQPKKLKTFWFGLNLGIYNTPYFSVFQNKKFIASGIGLEAKIGIARRGIKMFYLHRTINKGNPYNAAKIGFGYQYYFKGNYYPALNSWFTGTEINLMSIRFNNGVQFALEPFGGYERRVSDCLRLHIKLQLQFNLANKNNTTGINFTVGAHYLNRNFKHYYSVLNKQHRLLKR